MNEFFLKYEYVFISYIHLFYSKNIAYKYILYLLVAERERCTIGKVSSLPQYYRAELFFSACDDRAYVYV